MKTVYYSLIFLIFCCCNQTLSDQPVIIFGDVIGSYNGECADYQLTPNDKQNSEVSTLSVFASTIDKAGVSADCLRIGDFKIKVKSASASTVIFEENIDGIGYLMTYFSQNDSILLTRHNIDGSNVLFAGIRQ